MPNKFERPTFELLEKDFITKRLPKYSVRQSTPIYFNLDNSDDDERHVRTFFGVPFHDENKARNHMEKLYLGGNDPYDRYEFVKIHLNFKAFYFLGKNKDDGLAYLIYDNLDGTFIQANGTKIKNSFMDQTLPVNERNLKVKIVKGSLTQLFYLPRTLIPFPTRYNLAKAYEKTFNKNDCKYPHTKGIGEFSVLDVYWHLDAYRYNPLYPLGQVVYDRINNLIISANGMVAGIGTLRLYEERDLIEEYVDESIAFATKLEELSKSSNDPRTSRLVEMAWERVRRRVGKLSMNL